MEMMQCPHCGAQNSSKRDYCYQCQESLHAPPKAAAGGGHDYVPTCASCSHAAVFPPAGKRITSDQVWCMDRDEAVQASQVGGDCFSEAFGWRREEILD